MTSEANSSQTFLSAAKGNKVFETKPKLFPQQKNIGLFFEGKKSRAFLFRLRRNARREGNRRFPSRDGLTLR